MGIIMLLRSWGCLPDEFDIAGAVAAEEDREDGIVTDLRQDTAEEA